LEWFVLIALLPTMRIPEYPALHVQRHPAPASGVSGTF
jgi:hypothetical protein